MDVVVVLALVVLSIVFIVSLVVLILMCYRRRQSLQLKTATSSSSSPQRFSKLAENVDSIENLGQLSPLIGELLDRNIWVYDASGLMQHCVALLRLCRTLTEHLAVIPLSHAPQPISEAICMATRNIFPRFDDLLEVVASNTVDIRVLEARAMSLGTVCWALYLPFTLLNSKYKEILNEPLNEMNLHLVTIRTAAEMAIKSNVEQKENNELVEVRSNLRNFKNDLRGTTIKEEEDENEEMMMMMTQSTSMDDENEKTPLVASEEKQSEEKKGNGKMMNGTGKRAFDDKNIEMVEKEKIVEEGSDPPPQPQAPQVIHQIQKPENR